MQQRNISEANCEAAVANDRNPWRTKLRAGDHWRCYDSGSMVTVITDLSKQTVVTAFKGDPGSWGPETEGL
jgi:hypothetical protein